MDKTKIIKRKNKVIMKTTRGQIRGLKHLLKDDSHSQHHLRIEITKNILPHIFEYACGIEAEQKFEITKEQILEIYANGYGYTKIKKMFPEVFKKELETGYYKHKNGEHPKWFCRIDISTGIFYGHGNIGWMTGNSGMVEYIEENCEPMTPQEVETALIMEAKKKGIKNGVSIISTSGVIGLVNGGVWIFDKSLNKLYYGGYEIFDNGAFAKPIETITIQEAEKLLNKKIV